jgi:uncharacterized protein YcbX
MLLKVEEESPLKLKNMHITGFAAMCLFHTSIEGNTLTVKYIPAGSTVASHELQVPLEPPNFDKLRRVDVNMHHSPTRSYDMGEKYNMWFSELFGFPVILAFWGSNPRPVLGNFPGVPAKENPKPKSTVNRILSYVPVIGANLNEDDAVIAFNDCAPYLVITEKSAADVTTRLPEGFEIDITKFRANVILRGSPAAFDEDFWGELRFGDDTKLLLTGNCGRCVSLNVDYKTGKPGTGPDGSVLKLLSKDRRVDAGAKYSPIFGRYGFASKTSEGKVLMVGDAVVISLRNKERTKFCECDTPIPVGTVTNQELMQTGLDSPPNMYHTEHSSVVSDLGDYVE